MSQSATEENYLKAIYHLSENGTSVATNTLAKAMQTTPASVTDMIKRLSEKKLVNYQPYKGVSLMPAGEKIALKIIRKHRLWEHFLVKVLNFSWDSVHDTAEQLEHVNSPELIDRLDEFLNFPKFDPHGDPIPSKDGKIVHRETCLLAEINEPKTLTVAGVNEHSPDFLQYLARLGVTIGEQITILERMGFDDSLYLQVNGKEIIVSGEFARRIIVLKE